MARKPHTYWDEGIELFSGCEPCSPGCRYCWSVGMTHRFGDAALTYIDPEYEVPRFTGKVVFHPDRLARFNKKKPTVFSIWNDLFHESVDWSLRDKCYATMQKFNQHTYLILSKRPAQMRDYILRAMFDENCHYEGIYEEMELMGIGDDAPLADNVWHGLTVCNQQEADEKIPLFREVPGKKFLSIEPMLGEIEMGDGFDAVVLGCETGVNARPMNLEWAYSIAVQCELAGIPLFIKALTIDGKPNHNITDWPEVLRIRQLIWCQEGNT